MKLFGLLLIFSCLFFNSCTRREKSDSQTFTFKKEFEIGILDGDENYVFGTINDVEVDSKGNIYVLDGKMTRIVKFNKDGTFLLRFGKKGQGPGEFEFPENMAIDSEQKIFVLGIGKVLIFDDEGNHLQSFPYNFYGIDIVLDNKDNLILLGLQNEEIFHVYDRNGNHLYSYGTGFDVPNEFAKWKQARFMKLPIRLWSTEDEVYVMNPYRFEIHVYKNGEIADKLSKNTPDYKRPEIREAVPGGFAGYVANNLIQKSEGKLFIYYSGKTAKWLDIFVDGNCKKSLQVKGSLCKIDERGRFYFAEEDDCLKLVVYTLK